MKYPKNSEPMKWPVARDEKMLWDNMTCTQARNEKLHKVD
jgi:hypothetical protein